MGFRCETCTKAIGNKSYMEIYTVQSELTRQFCQSCIKMGLANLKRIHVPTPEQKDLMIKFEAFLRQVNRQKRRIES